MTGLEIIKAPTATAGEIADIIAAHCPPTIPESCDRLSCRECWAAWMTGEELEKKPEAPAEPEPRAGSAERDALDEAEKTLQDLFRLVCSGDTHDEEQARLISNLSTFGRLLEKERHASTKEDVEKLTKIATGLYDGSIIAQAKTKAGGEIEVNIVDTIHMSVIGNAVIKRMGGSYFVESVEFTSPRR